MYSAWVLMSINGPPPCSALLGNTPQVGTARRRDGMSLGVVDLVGPALTALAYSCGYVDELRSNMICQYKIRMTHFRYYESRFVSAMIAPSIGFGIANIILLVSSVLFDKNPSFYMNMGSYLYSFRSIYDRSISSALSAVKARWRGRHSQNRGLLQVKRPAR